MKRSVRSSPLQSRPSSLTQTLRNMKIPGQKLNFQGKEGASFAAAASRVGGGSSERASKKICRGKTLEKSFFKGLLLRT